MGMSASQARFLTLTARKTNVEFEGQQINQQRTTLSNESANYYSQLSSLDVPVPPSTEDYTRITYKFENGSEKNTVTSIVATATTKNDGVYMLNYVQEIPADNMVVNGTNIISKVGDDENADYCIGKVILQAVAKDSSGSETALRNKLIAGGVPTEVANQYSYPELQNKMKVENQYRLMANEKYGEQDWLVRYVENSSTGNYEPVFYSKSEIGGTDFNEKTGLSLIGIRAYMYGQTTETKEIRNAGALVEKDASGRFQALYIFNDETHTTGTRYQLTATTETDDNAYNDAMNQYLYEKTVYDQKIEEINAKIGIIQVQDKNLELKLKQLDTEENAISTEMDAVKKVISKNVESSFKTFNA